MNITFIHRRRLRPLMAASSASAIIGFFFNLKFKILTKTILGPEWNAASITRGVPKTRSGPDRRYSHSTSLPPAAGVVNRLILIICTKEHLLNYWI